jgi:oligopeptide/dipeptide ABC transporter ATP-binding protein
MAIFPGLAIVVTVLSVSLAADGLADVFDPKLIHGKFRRLPLPSRPKSSAPAQPRDTGTEEESLLRVRNLTTVFPTRDGVIEAVRDVSFDLAPGRVLGVVGESGSGKSTLGLSIIQLLDAPGRVTGGEVWFQDKDLARVSNQAMSSIRGAEIGMIFQDPGASLNPVRTVGTQLEETLRQHRSLRPAAARTAARQALAAVHIADPDRVLRAYPFQISGGMQQRVMIALAMASQPALLILDEPTSALDVTTQAQLLDELAGLRQRFGTSMIFISHDIALLSEVAETILVMYAGQVSEHGPRDLVIESPQHPYTQALLDAVERVAIPGDGRLAAIPGDPPDPANRAPGCPFAPRCPHAMPVCTKRVPEPVVVGPQHSAACHLLVPTGKTGAEADQEAWV